MVETKKAKNYRSSFWMVLRHPDQVPASKLRSEIGFPFQGEAKPEGDIEIKKLPGQHVLSTIHRGPYGKVGVAYAVLFQYASEKGFVPTGCPMEIYLNNPAEVPESELLTEIQLPIRKK